ncbi:hypothetical protein AAF712_015873 [Marasmius tenuissimus]|uniref:Uncharacterized protein n=1 Tax=Marasmius tenuissimus TaxID=585030 RepID=A0ABR2Z9N9_9AGAR
MCTVREWNLSYKCLTGFEAQECLRNIKNDDKKFWQELTTESAQKLRLTEGNGVTEDMVLELEDDEGVGDSNIQLIDMIADASNEKTAGHVQRMAQGGLESQSQAEEESDGPGTHEPVVKSETAEAAQRPQRARKPNKLYEGWWRHG